MITVLDILSPINLPLAETPSTEDSSSKGLAAVIYS